MAKYIWLPLVLALLAIGCSSEESSVIQNDENPAESAIDPVNDGEPAEGKIGYSAMSLKNPFFVIISDVGDLFNIFAPSSRASFRKD